MQIIDREKTAQLFYAQWEKLQQSDRDEVLFTLGSERFGLRKTVGEDLDDLMACVTSKIALFRPGKDLGVWEAEKVMPEESNIILLPDEVSARNFCVDFEYGTSLANEAQRLGQLTESPIIVTSESLTRPEFEGLGYGSALFTFSQLDLTQLVAQYRHLLHGRPVIAQVVDGAKNQTSGKEKNGWTSRQAIAHGYTRQPEYHRRPVWHKEIIIPV